MRYSEDMLIVIIMSSGQEKYLIVFDGVCNLCNWAVHFVIQRDPKAKFLFIPLQSQYGRQLSLMHQLKYEKTDSIQLIKNGSLFIESDAIFEIIKELTGLWRYLIFLKFCPRFIRNYIYRWIAKNRYQIFGKKETCMLPTPDIWKRFKLE